ncbi:MAG: hypothetical protein KDK70_28930, partial [Myxococcales bacterium]|nr:hypothetical protein [Myxococcales bacterium]
MATEKVSTKVSITNQTDGNASIILYHRNDWGTQTVRWEAGPGQTVGSVEIPYEIGAGSYTQDDYWSVTLLVKDGSSPGQYINGGSLLDPYIKECQLQHEDADHTLTFRVDTNKLEINTISRPCDDDMVRFGPSNPHHISHVFVLVLENRSFDNLFAMSGIQGIQVATPENANTYDGVRYPVHGGAPAVMTTDPGHEFLDVVEQLAGEGAVFPEHGPYPPVNMSGFAANYATSTTEGPKPDPSHIGDIMAMLDTNQQVPGLASLARNFAICDHWFSSLPGPTWPNRFFVHGASSSGLDDSPSGYDIFEWETVSGFEYGNDSIYEALKDAGLGYRLYADFSLDAATYRLSLFSSDPEASLPGDMSGSIPQVASLHGVSMLDINSLEHFASDLRGPYPYPYTFIEPHYGDIMANTYVGGSSQHPMDDPGGGDALVQFVFNAIRLSPYWQNSLLIITYDEHGGFYDSVSPGPAVPPGDTPPHDLNQH